MSLAHNVMEGTRTRDIETFVDVTFESMLLSNNTLNGLQNSGFCKPSPIQLHGIPLGKCGFDLFLEAKSGTGKTAVFTVIALENLDLSKGLQAIILTPTREIAAQIKDVIEQIGSSYLDLSVEVVMGGLPLEEDIQKLQRKLHILVGSPGRMRHLIHSKHIDVSAVRMFVLDEADKLMDKCFIADINYIFSVLPKQKQVIMSSATFPESLKTIMQNYVQTVQHICPDSTSILLGIKQLVTTVKSHINIVRQTQIKFEELVKILSSREFKQCLVFCNYQVRVGELCKMLIREKWPADQLHGQLEQAERLDALKTLQQYKCRILVSTDLAARGIDASNVDLVVNFEPPYEWQTYLHRIGRTGRFGSYGTAITILSEGKEVTKFKQMIRNISRSIKINYLWSDDMFLCYDSTEKSKEDILEPSKGKSEICNTTEAKEMSDATELKAMSITLQMGESIQTAAVKDKINISGIDETNNTQSKQMSKTPEAESSNVAEKEVKDYSKDILETLKFENIEIIEDQSFPKLSNSFTTTEQLKIESFNDLLTSFKVHKPNDTENIEIQDASFRGCLEPNEDQNFSHLFNSFESTEELKIESFNDLLASFKVHKPNDSENIGIQDTNFRGCLEPISSAETEPDIILELHTNSDNEIEVRNSNEYIEKGKVTESPTSSHEEKQLSENSPTVIINSDSSIKTDIIMKQLILDKRDDIGRTQSSHNALISAGLPVSFSSTKHSNSNRVNESKTKKDSKKIFNKKKSNDIIHNPCKNESPQIHNKVSNFRSSSEASPVSLEDDGYNTHSCLYRRSAKHVQSQSKVTKERHNTSNINDMHNVYNQRHTNNMETTSDIYRNYTTWYKLLKTQMKQVEMSLYMNELSKI